MKSIKSTEDGTSFTYDFYIKHKTYSNIFQLESEIDDIKSNIRDIKERIFGFAVATPTRKEGDTISDMISEIKFAIDEEFEYLEENLLILYKLNLLKEEMEHEEYIKKSQV